MNPDHTLAIEAPMALAPDHPAPPAHEAALPPSSAPPDLPASTEEPPRRKRRGRKKPAQEQDRRQGELAIDAPAAESAEAAEAPAVEAQIRSRIEVFGIGIGRVMPAISADLVLADESVLEIATASAPVVECLPRDAATLEARLRRAGEARVALLIDGDPASEGPGRALLAALGPARVRLTAAAGPAQQALARLGIGLELVEFVDLDRVGRGGLAARLRRGRLYALGAPGIRPPEIGRQLEAGGFHQARVWLVEPDPLQPVRALLAFELSDSPVEFPRGTQVVAYTACGDGSTREWPGIEAEALHDALPEAARLLALSWLQPAIDELGWCIEPAPALALDWSHALPAASIHCVGCDDDTLDAACERHAAGEGLSAQAGGSFRELEQLPDPAVVFIRAGEEFTQQIRTAWDRLLAGGRLVVAAEDEQARQDLMHFANREPPLRWQDLSVATGEQPGRRARLLPAHNVRLMAWRKPPRG